MVRRRLANSRLFVASAAPVALAAALGLQPGAAATLTIDDIRRVVVLEQPAISPDGSRIALVVTRDEVNSLVLIDTISGSQTVVAHGGNAADPRWSPDGGVLAYVQEDRAGGHMQIFAISGRKQARAVTHSPTDVIDLAWSPNGKTIAFAAARPQTDPGYFYAGDNDYTQTTSTAPIQLWLVPSSGGAAKALTRGSWTLAPTDSGGIFSPQFAWTHDARHIIFTRVANTFSGDDEYSTLWEIDVASQAMRKMTQRNALELSPSFSPDGSRMLYNYPRDGNYLAFNTLRLRSTGSDTEVTAHFDYNTGGSLWMPDGRSLLICANDHTRSTAWLFPLTGSPHRLNLGALNIVCDSYQSSTFDSGIAASVSRSGGIAFLANTEHHARELYYLSSPHGTPRVLTHYNDGLARVELGSVREIQWNGRDGFREYGVVTYPPHMIAGRKYPIVVNIHGGPGDSSLRNFAWEGWPRAALMAAHGYIVFEPNYRGSDDNGNAFALAIFRDTVSGPADDILRGLASVRALPQADTARIAVCGWSYGGLLTSWLITQRHFWRAAVSGAAVNNETGEYALSESNVQDRYYLGTSPYAKGGAAIYDAQSPITFAGQVTTPTLLWGTTLDPVVPIPQMYEFFHALLEHHVPVRFAVFPASTHGPADTRQTLILTRLWLEWLDRYLH